MATPPTPEMQEAMRAADWEDRRKLVELLVVSGVFTALSFVFVGLRLVSRIVFLRNAKVDDYLIVGALVGVLGYMTCLGFGASYHMGYPVTMVTLDDVVGLLKATLAIEVLYYNIIFAIKSSILFTYLRFAVSRTFRNLCYGTIALHSVFYVICVVTTLLQCQPLHKMWDLMGTVDGACINTTAFFYSTSGFNIVTDIWILVLPLKTLASIQRPRREKIALYAIFGCGSFACIAAIVRLHTIYRYTLSADPFRDSTLINLWSMIEVNIAICCASVSALKPIFSRSQRLRSSQRQTGPSGRRGHSGISGLSRTGDTGSSAIRSRGKGSWDQLGGGSIGTATTDNEVAEVQPFPPTRPLPQMSQGGDTSNNTLDPESPNQSDESSMFVFTPLSPPSRVAARGSTGSGGDGVLVIQR